MIFAPVYQFHIYIYILCLLGLLRDCEIFANLHLKLYLQVRAGDGPHPPLRLAAGLQPGVAGVALRSARPARGLVHQQRVVPRRQHSHHLPHHDQLRLDAGRGHISTHIYTISTHIYTYLRRAPSSTSCWCSPSCRRLAWCGCCGCWAGSHPASACCPTLSTAPTTRSHHCLQLHTIY